MANTGLDATRSQRWRRGSALRQHRSRKRSSLDRIAESGARTMRFVQHQIIRHTRSVVHRSLVQLCGSLGCIGVISSSRVKLCLKCCNGSRFLRRCLRQCGSQCLILPRLRLLQL